MVLARRFRSTTSAPSPITKDGNKYTLLVADRFSRRVAMYAVRAAQFTVVGTADILVHDFIPK